MCRGDSVEQLLTRSDDVTRGIRRFLSSQYGLLIPGANYTNMYTFYRYLWNLNDIL